MMYLRNNYNNYNFYSIIIYVFIKFKCIFFFQKIELKNFDKVYFNLEVSEDDIWEFIKDVFIVFEYGCIKG